MAWTCSCVDSIFVILTYFDSVRFYSNIKASLLGRTKDESIVGNGGIPNIMVWVWN
jgi:hypothetical protein